PARRARRRGLRARSRRASARPRQQLTRRARHPGRGRGALPRRVRQPTPHLAQRRCAYAERRYPLRARVRPVRLDAAIGDLVPDRTLPTSPPADVDGGRGRDPRDAPPRCRLPDRSLLGEPVRDGALWLRTRLRRLPRVLPRVAAERGSALLPGGERPHDYERHRVARGEPAGPRLPLPAPPHAALALPAA